MAVLSIEKENGWCRKCGQPFYSPTVMGLTLAKVSNLASVGQFNLFSLLPCTSTEENRFFRVNRDSNRPATNFAVFDVLLAGTEQSITSSIVSPQ